MRRQRVIARLAVALGALAAGTGLAAAHQISASRFASPIPLGFLYGGAAVTVLVTAVLSARLVTSPETYARTTTLLSPRATRALTQAVQVLSVVVFLVLLVQGLTGRQVRASNVATLVTWALAFDGLALVAALVGSPWRVLAPWYALYDLLCALEDRRIALTDANVDRLGQWPALVGFVVVVGILENLTVVPESPADTAGLLSVYALWMVGGLLLFGPAWGDHADPIGAFLDLFARAAPLRVSGGDGISVTLRAPWRATARPVASLGMVAFTVATVYTISFDGFTSTPQFRATLFWTHDTLGVPFSVVGIALYLAGYAGFLAAFAATAAAVERLGSGRDPRSAARAIAATVLPIAVAYEFAHYGTYVVKNASRLTEVALGGIGVTVSLAPLAGLSVPVWWGFEVVVIVLGHVVAVVAAHYAALARYEDHTLAWRAHAPLVALMVCYTVLSLWIISQPVVM